jgi:hypothetical protein
MKKAFFILILLLNLPGFSQRRFFQLPSYDVVRTGPYVGYQWGNFGVFEVGFERQWKELKLFKPKTTAVYGGLNYNYSEGVIGCDLGVWRKLGFLGITYGVAGIYRTDLTYNKVGVSPMLGWKVGRFHLHVGYQFMIPNQQEPMVNEFYTTLRFKVWSKKKITKS